MRKNSQKLLEQLKTFVSKTDQPFAINESADFCLMIGEEHIKACLQEYFEYEIQNDFDSFKTLILAEMNNPSFESLLEKQNPLLLKADRLTRSLFLLANLNNKHCNNLHLDELIVAFAVKNQNLTQHLEATLTIIQDSLYPQNISAEEQPLHIFGLAKELRSQLAKHSRYFFEQSLNSAA